MTLTESSRFRQLLAGHQDAMPHVRIERYQLLRDQDLRSRKRLAFRSVWWYGSRAHDRSFHPQWVIVNFLIYIIAPAVSHTFCSVEVGLTYRRDLDPRYQGVDRTCYQG